MCGRYNFTAEEAAEIKEITREIREKLRQQKIKTGEIYPTNTVPVLVPGDKGPEAAVMTWGFPRFNGGGVVINARSETVTEKKMFRASVLTRRCIVPSTGFFEWSRNGGEKTKYLFRRPGEPVLYMAGCWDTFREQDGSLSRRFVILTTQANDSMREDVESLSLFPEEQGQRSLIHDRMPVVLSADEREQWLRDGMDFERLLHRQHVQLEKQAV